MVEGDRAKLPTSIRKGYAIRTAFTICAANYLAKARVLGESLLEHNPDYRFTIFLVDEPTPQICEATKSFGMISLVPIAEIGVPDFEGMLERYDVVELSTAVKPHCFRYLMAQLPDAEFVLYFDPDIMVFAPFDSLIEGFRGGEIWLTPQIACPTYSEPHKSEFSALAGGMYNLGFIGLVPGNETKRFLSWWACRLERHSRRQPSLGLHYDQSWVDFAPIFFDGAMISRHLGLNLGPWNIHERRVERSDEGLRVNGRDPLVFIHFSHFDACAPRTIAARDPSCKETYDSRPDLAPLYEAYRQRLSANRHDYFSAIPWAFARRSPFGLANATGAVIFFLARLAKRLLPRKLVREAKRRLEMV